MSKRKILKWSAFLVLLLALALSLGDTAVRVARPASDADAALDSASSVNSRRVPRSMRISMLSSGADSDPIDLCYDEELGASDAADRLAALAGAFPSGTLTHRVLGAPSIGDAEVAAAFGGSVSFATAGISGGSNGAAGYPLYAGAGGIGAGGPSGGGGVPPSTTQSVPEPSSLYLLFAGLLVMVVSGRQFTRKVVSQTNCAIVE